jgi:hypothetical protein
VKIFFCSLFCLFATVSKSQYSIPADSTKTAPVEAKSISKRKLLVGGFSIAAYGGSILLLNQAWYKQYPKTGFHTYNDSGEWLQMDKVGHAWTAYNISKLTTGMWRWAGLPEKKAILVGSLSGFSYLSAIELLDAYSSKWGWSWADMSANAAGSSLFAAQELAWQEQKIQFKFSAHRKSYEAGLNARADELFGSSLPERILKDYNAQVYWFSGNLSSFFAASKLPKWLNIAVGYSAEGMFGGYENVGFDKNGIRTFYRPDIRRYRQWYFAPDVDLSKINVRNKTARTVLMALNAIKFPAPAIEISNGRIRGNWIVF